MLDHVPLNWRSTTGIVYVASPRICVKYGSMVLQYGFTTEPAVAPANRDPSSELFAPFGPVPCSGTAAFNAQLSEDRRPVLVTPCIVTPLRSRALTLTSTPCQ